ncbi:hypothetical protein HPB50_019973 [Hyalomma asiaticum]|uniref:Uncharacterized protein n=1 Tax=Hyalomma asiaticum TaxID=266040 RepID=A0ACB7SPR4_HYAAI|nr:hypothetical protein HPB50_019973 [Hyalomma asiaticum]
MTRRENAKCKSYAAQDDGPRRRRAREPVAGWRGWHSGEGVSFPGQPLEDGGGLHREARSRRCFATTNLSDPQKFEIRKFTGAVAQDRRALNDHWTRPWDKATQGRRNVRAASSGAAAAVNEPHLHHILSAGRTRQSSRERLAAVPARTTPRGSPEDKRASSSDATPTSYPARPTDASAESTEEASPTQPRTPPTAECKARKRVKARCDIGRARVNRANSDGSATSRVETKRGHFFVRASGEFAN